MKHFNVIQTRCASFDLCADFMADSSRCAARNVRPTTQAN